MLPLYDANPRTGPPKVTLALIALNALAFLYELALPAEDLMLLFLRWGMVPAAVLGGVEDHPSAGWLTLLSCTFLHGSLLHAGGNLWMLWLFGDNVEDRLGHLRFLLFYLLCGLAASVTQLVFSPGATIPTIGASGAVAGVMGAYFLLFPRARIVTLVFLFIFVDIVALPAGLFLGLWVLLQVWSGAMTFGQPDDIGGVAFWAHVGGFAAGAGLLLTVLRPRPPRPEVLPSRRWQPRRRF